MFLSIYRVYNKEYKGKQRKGKKGAGKGKCGKECFLIQIQYNREKKKVEKGGTKICSLYRYIEQYFL